MDDFDAAELADLRADVQELMDQTALIVTAGRTSNGRGGQTEDWGAGATTVSTICCVLPASSRGDQVEGQKQSSDQRRRMRFPYGTVITTLNRIRIGALTYEVLGVLSDQSLPLATDVDTKRLA